MTANITERLRAKLGPEFSGRTSGPGDENYDRDRKVWNATVDKYPSLIAECKSHADVSAAVRASRDLDVALSVRGGGHQVAGLSVCDGLVVDLAGMRTGAVDPARRVARVGGGSLLSDVDKLTQQRGLITPAGVISHTGLGGLALGGGVGWTCRHFGLTCDNIVAADLVTADGDLLRVNEHQEPEVLWALRGGGGNFGVVTTFELALHEVADVLFGQAVFALGDAAEAMTHYRDVMADAPDELTAVLVLRAAPPLPGVPPHLVGHPVVMVNVAWSGTVEQGEIPVRRLIENSPSVASRIVRQSYLKLQTMQDEFHPHGMYNYMKSRYLTALDDGAIDALLTAASTAPGPHSQIEVLRLGGAVGRVPTNATAFSGRDAHFIANVGATWTNSSDKDDHIDWARHTYTSLDHVGSDAGCVNFLGDEPERARSVYSGTTYERLQQLKSRLDPDEVFSGNIAIRLAESAESPI